MSASTSAPPPSRSYRAARSAAQRRWRAGSGRVRRTQLDLAALGWLYDHLDKAGRRLMLRAIGGEIVEAALIAHAREAAESVS